jgi:hypothetical protein
VESLDQNGDLDTCEADMRRNAINGHRMIRAAPLAAGAAIFATLALAVDTQGAVIDSRFDICAALRDGTSLAAIETTLEAHGYTATNAGVLTGKTIRQHCPDQATNAMAQAQIPS